MSISIIKLASIAFDRLLAISAALEIARVHGYRLQIAAGLFDACALPPIHARRSRELAGGKRRSSRTI
ncbi:hypothetical protein MPLDJ20_130084 [Mesorhizobium plurifarium]|uniref:Uncharacterized protein n=1 Tax=Mesorhizobium plurifarium TaxID=69974 RepID=A0A090GGK3_MESPL|nr:hypothetical protein MPLDJ20_130084 [Mesorhizobium plurifarium]